MLLRMKNGARYTVNAGNRMVTFTKDGPEQELSDKLVEQLGLLEEVVPVFNADGNTVRDMLRFERVEREKNTRPPAENKPEAK